MISFWYTIQQMTAFLLIFIIGSQIENQLLSTGAFEVSLNSEWCTVYFQSQYDLVTHCNFRWTGVVKAGDRKTTNLCRT